MFTLKTGWGLVNHIQFAQVVQDAPKHLLPLRSLWLYHFFFQGPSVQHLFFRRFTTDTSPSNQDNYCRCSCSDSYNTTTAICLCDEAPLPATGYEFDMSWSLDEMDSLRLACWNYSDVIGRVLSNDPHMVTFRKKKQNTLESLVFHPEKSPSKRMASHCTLFFKNCQERWRPRSFFFARLMGATLIGLQICCCRSPEEADKWEAMLKTCGVSSRCFEKMGRFNLAMLPKK